MNTDDENIKKQLYKNGIEAFKQHQFYDAHEYWEDLWSDYRLVDAKFIQGLIQLSVGYFHISNNNKNGARNLFNKCIPKLMGYSPKYRGMNIDNILICINNTLKCLSEIDDMKNFNWDFVPNIEE